VADAVTMVVHGSEAVPPYAGEKVVVTRPAGIVTDPGTVTQSVFADVSVMVRAGCAAMGVPLLSSWMVICGGDRVSGNETEVARISSSARLVTVVVDGE
jgi:hypothetical protein